MGKAKLTPDGRPALCAMTGSQLVAGIEYSSQAEEFSFFYSRPWRERPDSFPLSPHIPLTAEEASSRRVRDHLENLLPEGEARWIAARRNQVSATNIFALVMLLCREPAGAVGFDLDVDGLVRPEEREPGSRELGNRELSQRIRNREEQPFSIWDGEFYQSLAGAHDKLQVQVNDGSLQLVSGSNYSSHILKPEPQSRAPRGVVANEHFCLCLAAAVGLPAARVHILRVPEPVLMVERFDRVRNFYAGMNLQGGVVERIHVIDACQALGKSSYWKFECPDGRGGGCQLKRAGIGFRALFSLREHLLVPTEDKKTIARWALFNLMIGNSDAHAKNISFFQTCHGLRPGPAYDIVCTRVYDLSNEMAMAFGYSFLAEDVTDNDLVIFAGDAGISCAELIEEIKNLASAMMQQAPLVAKSDCYSLEEQDLIRKIVSFINGQATHLLTLASGRAGEFRLGHEMEIPRTPNESSQGSTEIEPQPVGEQSRPSQRLLAQKA